MFLTNGVIHATGGAARPTGDSVRVTVAEPRRPTRRPRLHWAWVVAAVSFVAILGAAGFRSVPGVMMNPLHHEFGWSHGTVGLAMSVNMTLFGLTAPFAAALMDRFGVRPVLTAALLLIAAGSALSRDDDRQLAAGAAVGRAGRRRHRLHLDGLRRDRSPPAGSRQRRGLVTGVLTAASATGQLIFLPVVAEVTDPARLALGVADRGRRGAERGAAGAGVHARTTRRTRA